ncbi:MAG: hypothetical protein AAFP67_04295 [Pseudomonadota bacterium]
MPRKPDATLSAPVALFVHRRTAFLPGILERISAARPPRVFVFADAPRDGTSDAEHCAAVLALIEDWACPCPVEISVAPQNLGNSERLRSGIDAVFAETDRAIFVEDDVELSPSFFPFCDALLERYDDTPEVMMISGLNPLDVWPEAPDAAGYHFSSLGHAQAWASWRRAWARTEGALMRWQLDGAFSRLAAALRDEEIAEERRSLYDAVAAGRISSWDYEWALARQLDHGLCAVPARNLALHRGNDPGATHVRRSALLYRLGRLHEHTLPDAPPPALEADRRFDRIVFELGHDRVSASSARHLAGRLIDDGRRLLAVALLRHAMADGGADPETERMIRAALKSAGASAGIGDIEQG